MRVALTHRQENAAALMREALGDDYVSLALTELQLRENFTANTCEFSCRVLEEPSGRQFPVASRGVGLVDAFFRGVLDRYLRDHASLSSIRLTGFAVQGHFDSAGSGAATDAGAEACVAVTNSYGTEFEFRALSPSVSQSSLEAVLGAIEYFLNSERAYLRIFKSLEAAKEAQRADLVAKWTAAAATMIRNTSYSQVLADLENGASPA